MTPKHSLEHVGINVSEWMKDMLDEKERRSFYRKLVEGVLRSSENLAREGKFEHRREGAHLRIWRARITEFNNKV
jgi:hypothetical protein